VGLVTGDWAGLAELARAGSAAAPPTLLRARPLEDAQEVLICTFTSDLRFFESTCLTEARAMRARVTVVRDADHGTPIGEVRHAGSHYTDVPVRCRSGGAFHPKLVVIVGFDRAVVAIGSGNMTSAGWHHNAEMWTVLAATSSEWPDTFVELSEWLRRLPGHLHVDSFGADRIAAVAGLLAEHPAGASGPRLVHNLDRPMIHAIPYLSRSPHRTGATELAIASPFLDTGNSALAAVTRRLRPATATLALTVNAVGPAGGLAGWESGQRHVTAIASSRYHHGKLIEWHAAGARTALVGSANLTAAALLRRADEPSGNCELGLLLDLPDPDTSLLPATADAPIEDLGEFLTPPGEGEHGAATPYLLRVLTDGSVTTVNVLVRSTPEGAAYPPDWSAEGPRLLGPGLSAPLTVGTPASAGEEPAADLIMTLRAGIGVAPGAPCQVKLPGGWILGPVPATNAAAVVLRPGAASPLEDSTIGHILGDARLTDRLFRALAELAQLRPEPGPGAGREIGVRSGWRTSAERIVGPALITLALGRRGPTLADADGRVFDTAVSDAPTSGAQDEDPDDESTWETDDDAQLDSTDPWAVDHDPVSLLRLNPATAARLGRRVERLVPELADWSLPALLVLTKVVLITAAGGGWPADQWPNVLAAALAHLGPDDDIAAELDDSRRAVALTGLAALANEVNNWDEPSDARTRFEAARAHLNLDARPVDEGLLEHTAGDLRIGLGPNLTAAAIRDATPFLLASPLARVAEAISDQYPSARLAAPRLIEVAAPTPRLSLLLRLLSRCSDYAPVAVRLLMPTGSLLGVWSPKTLTLQYELAASSHGADYHLTVGPGAHADGRLPRPSTRWTGPLSSGRADDLRREGLLDPLA
jgi:hypothetical protein